MQASARPVSALNDRREGDRVLAAVVADLSEVPVETQAILRAVTRTLSRVRRGTWVTVLMDRDPTTSQVVTADEWDPDMARYIDDLVAATGRPGRMTTSGVSREVIESGTPFLRLHLTRDEFMPLHTPEAQQYISTLDAPPEYSDVSMIVVPMRARGATMGTLGYFDWAGSNSLSEGDAHWVQAIADRLALALLQAQVEADARDRRERLAAIGTVTMAATSSEDLRLILQVIVEQVTARLGVDAADILLVVGDDSTASIGVHSGFRTSSVPDYRLPIDSGLLVPDLLRPRALTMNDPAKLRTGSFQRASLFAREGFQAYLGVPLQAHNHLVGVLEVFHRSDVDRDADWLDFLDTLGGLAAIAIDAAAARQRLETIDRRQGPQARGPEFSQLERHILQLIVEGATNREISGQVHLSQNTIKFHVRQLLQKTGTANRTDLTRRATLEGWL